MKWREDSGMAKEMLQDLGEEIGIGGEEYNKVLPHVSELNYCLTASYLNRVMPLPYSEKEVALFVGGVGMEKVLLAPQKQHTEGEFQGIHYNMDFLTKYGKIPAEMKSTRKSSKHFPDEIPLTWLRQMLAYMKVTNSLEVTLASFHLMGNYSPPFPTLHCWHGKAEPGEVQANWAWMLLRKQVYLDHLERKTMPKQFTFNEPWECDYCRYKLICTAREAADEQQKEG